MDEYKDALFENTHQLRATDESREKVFGVNFTAWANGEDAVDTVWDTADEDAAPNDAKTPTNFVDGKAPSGQKSATHSDDVPDETSDFDDDNDESNDNLSTPIRTVSGDDALDMKSTQAGGALTNADVRVQLKEYVLHFPNPDTLFTAPL